ncbi:MAG: uncharacterized protein JWR45_795 [Blastococcus sp.]|jgi:hypothetical protein|nr:uncharacterized protein [Blastococcus sp.]
MPAAAAPPTEVCPGCGAVLVPVGEAALHPGASASCARLFEVTLRGLREQAVTDPGAAAAVQSADAAYDAQHPDPADPGRLRAALEFFVTSPGWDVPPSASEQPRIWQMTIADVAADLDVIDLPVLVGSWAATVAEDWIATARAAT